MKSLGVINLPGDRSTYSFTLSNSGADQITAFRDTDNSIDALLVRHLHHRMVEGRGRGFPSSPIFVNSICFLLNGPPMESVTRTVIVTPSLRIKSNFFTFFSSVTVRILL